MPLVVSDYQDRLWIVTLLQKIVQFKPFLEQAQSDMSTTAEGCFQLLQALRNTQDFYQQFVARNIPNSLVVSVVGSQAKAIEMQNVVDDLIALRPILKSELNGVQVQFNSNDSFSWPPLQQSSQNIILPLIQSALTFYG